MDFDRPPTGKPTERPVTRWRREQEKSNDKATSKIEKMERPTSRRGIKDDIEDYSNFRSATPGRNALARPPSASIMSNRIPTAMSSATGLTRLNTGLSISGQMNVNTLERPITQHGIAGIRPGTTRGLSMTRQVQDKRYYEGLLQLKMRELSQEIATIMRDIDMQNKERATILHYDKRAKDLAAELTTLQGELADYNIVVDKMTSNVDKESVEQEAKELALKNGRATAEIEEMFERRQAMEQQLRRMEKEIEVERQHTEKLVDIMDPLTRRKYDELCKRKAQLQESIDRMQEEVNELSKEHANLEEQIALSPLKQEAVKLHIKIVDAEEKRDKLKVEERDRLSPETEREQLLQKIKQDNMDIAAAEAQLANKKKQIAEVERELEQLETDLEDNQTEKQTKYKELRKREEVMEQFVSTFEQNKAEEMERIRKLEKSIVEYLEILSNGVNGNTNLTTSEEASILSNKSNYDDYERTSRDQSFEVLSNDYLKLQQTLRKFEILEHKLRSEVNNLNEQISNRQSELIGLEDLNGLKVKFEMKQEDVIVEHKKLIEEQTISEQELNAVKDDYNEIKARLDKNRIFLEIEALEKKLINLREENKKTNNFLVQQRECIDFIPRKQQALKLMKEYNTILRENIRTVY
ncbi:hypothetical protein KPH14_008731 [Odynerus spinipes]|uniref:Cyclic nucleotide-binding domain-containing protein n=1 Tax=Odynerus spinipes TaxID=1348599 RepID=A0AAD9VHN7_9HYME|nr:hypothetical protein KPH14_008731 [Odynerus spinipes]